MKTAILKTIFNNVTLYIRYWWPSTSHYACRIYGAVWILQHV